LLGNYVTTGDFEIAAMKPQWKRSDETVIYLSKFNASEYLLMTVFIGKCSFIPAFLISNSFY